MGVKTVVQRFSQPPKQSTSHSFGSGDDAKVAEKGPWNPNNQLKHSGGELGSLALVGTDRLEISVCEAWQRQHDPVRGPGFVSELRGLETFWTSVLLQVEAWPWGLDAEPGRLNENQTGSGLRKNYHGFLENVLKEGNESCRGSVY